MEETRRCTRCAAEKPLSAFYKDRTARDGRRPSCAECHRSANAACYARHQAKRNQYDRGRSEQRRDYQRGYRAGRRHAAKGSSGVQAASQR